MAEIKQRERTFDIMKGIGILQECFENAKDISFIIPYFNGQLTITRCINSIYAIGLKEEQFEIIVVDDVSSIPVQSVITDILKKKSNIQVIRHSQNKGPGGAKNTGIKVSSGEYLVFADQDDYVIPKGQREAIKKALTEKPDLLACKWEKSYNNGERKEFGLDLPDDLSVDGRTYCETWFDSNVCLAPWSYLYRRRYLLSMNRPFAEEVLMEDSDWVAWHLFFAGTIKYHPSPIYCWVMNPLSITHSQSWRHKADWVKFGYRKIKDSITISSFSHTFADSLRKDGIYNIECLFKKLWKTDNYYRFYHYLGTDLIRELRKIPWSKLTSFMLNHVCISILLLSIIGPCIKGIRSIKNLKVFRDASFSNNTSL